ncbi:L-threonylcarbamoyladenylate synthase [Lentisphaerota bacterium WC36G]|nr:threonylcarbamoyl-AMP synthase [Lentisphaerae bacterium WC36]
MTLVQKNKAIFLDRDGNVIHDKGAIISNEQVVFYEGVFESLKKLQDAGYLLFMISNQMCIATGDATIAEVDAVNDYIDCVLKEHDIVIKDWYICPHHPDDNCLCRKPKKYFIDKAVAEYNLDLSKSFIIGDHPSDVKTAEFNSMTGLYVLTGHGAKHLDLLDANELVFHNINTATQWILKHPNSIADLEAEIVEGVERLKAGEAVALPTETVYGLGADAFNVDAVKKIFTIKGRPMNNPLIVHVANYEQVKYLTAEIPDVAKKLMDAFWPGPLTIILPKLDIVPDFVTANNPTVAIRMPNNRWALKLIADADTPLAAPSANAFGCTSPTTAEHVENQLQNKCFVIDGGASRVGVESTVITLTEDIPKILRFGGITQEQIAEIIGRVTSGENKVHRNFESPGMLAGHYAPNTQLVICEDVEQIKKDFNSNDYAIMLLQDDKGIRVKNKIILSSEGNLVEAAVNLYSSMRYLDTLNCKKIVTHKFPNYGLGLAINDRLKRAETGSKK